jgi:nucleoid-associated protein YgaU
VRLVKGIRTLALSALLFSSSSCTTDGTEEPVDTVEEENRIPGETEEVVDSELPSPEAASLEAQQGVESIDSNSEGGVQGLPTEQQLAVDESANAIDNGAGQEIAAASTVGAETESPALPEAPIAQAETPMASPAMPAEVAPVETIPTIADVVADSESTHADAVPVKEKKAKKAKAHKSKARVAQAPVLSGNEKVYVVQPGDTLGSISATLYGSSREWKSLADMNGLDSKGRIFPGDAIKYSSNESTAAFESRFDGLTKASVTVEKGDTLSSIANRLMGQASFWKLLWRWNETAVTDPNRIAVGQTLQYVSKQDLDAASSAAPEATPAH